MDRLQLLQTTALISLFAIFVAGIRSPPPKNKTPCTKAVNCENSGCCLNGTCSNTGHAEGMCYISVKENGQVRPAGVWNKTDVCPCGHAYYCYAPRQTSANTHPTYGVIGYCNLIMG